MAKATQTIKSKSEYKITVKPKSSSTATAQSGMVTCHMCGKGMVPAAWYTGKRK